MYEVNMLKDLPWLVATLTKNYFFNVNFFTMK